MKKIGIPTNLLYFILRLYSGESCTITRRSRKIVKFDEKEEISFDYYTKKWTSSPIARVMPYEGHFTFQKCMKRLQIMNEIVFTLDLWSWLRTKKTTVFLQILIFLRENNYFANPCIKLSNFSCHRHKFRLHWNREKGWLAICCKWERKGCSVVGKSFQDK